MIEVLHWQFGPSGEFANGEFSKNESGGPMPPVVGSCQLVVLTAGSISWRIPELGAKRVEAGEWCLFTEGKPSSRCELGESTEGCVIELPIERLLLPGETSSALPGKLACLQCPERNSAFFEQGICDGRLRHLALALSARTNEKTADLANRWRRQSDLAALVATLLARRELRAECSCQTYI